MTIDVLHNGRKWEWDKNRSTVGLAWLSDKGNPVSSASLIKKLDAKAFTLMSQPYYTLAVRVNGKWGPEFGDYDRETVKDEMEDCENEWCDMKVIRSGDTQKEIDAAIDYLNK